MGSKPTGISGSRAATILGLNSFQSKYELWQLLMEEQYPGFNSLQGYVMPENPDNASIRWGTAFEDSVVKLAEDKAEMRIINREKFVTRHRFKRKSLNRVGSNGDVLVYGDFITCHIDGIYQEKSNIIRLHEGKTTSYWQYHDTWGEPGTDKVPAYVQCQVQHQLLCIGAEKCIVSVLVFPKRPDEWENEGREIVKLIKGDYEIQKHDPTLEPTYIKPTEWASVLAQMGYFHQYPITANKDLHKEMVDVYKEWWQKHIIEKQEPTPEEVDDMKRCFPSPVGNIIASEEIERLCAEYKDIGKEISGTGRLGKMRKEVKVKILDWMRKQDSVIDSDSREKTVLYDRAGKRLISWNGKAFR